jgi:anti-sigma B factor antagonist
MLLLRIKKRDLKGVAILDLDGRLDMGPAVSALAQHVEQAAATTEPKVVLNLEGVTFVDSMGLGELVASYTTVNNRGGRFALANPSELVGNLLKAARLPDVIQVHDTVDQAVADLS